MISLIQTLELFCRGQILFIAFLLLSWEGVEGAACGAGL